MTQHTIDNTSLPHILNLICDINANPISKTEQIALLKSWINTLRVDPHHYSESNYTQHVNDKIDALIKLLKNNQSHQTSLGKFLLQLINQYNPDSIFADIDISSYKGFFSKLTQLISHRVLPMVIDDNDIMSLIDEVFDKDYDITWLLAVDLQKYDALINCIHLNDDDLHMVATTKNNILNAMVVLSQRISGMGLNKELMSKYPHMLNYSSAFVAQNQETLQYVDNYRKLHQLDNLTDFMPVEDVNPNHLQVMLEQCQDIVKTTRKQIYKTGVSVELISVLFTLEKSINRLNLLIGLVSNNQGKRYKSIFFLVHSLVKHGKKRFSVVSLVNNNTRLLSQKITENASKVGEHYITTDKSGYYKMFKKAAIGGLIIPIMATLKILSYEWSVAPLWRAIIDSFIYGFGFVLIHILHGTVATKQPAMTAAAIASTISDSAQESGKKAKHQLNSLSELIVDIMRSQGVAIAGNILLAMPIAFIVSWLWLSLFGNPFITEYKASGLIADLNPISSLAIPHAMLAGVFLFFSGLVAGYYDNLAVSNQIGKRIANHGLLTQWLNPKKLAQFSNYIQNNLGALMSNFSFGMLLGSTGTIGYILGLPLDIRHIAFASANLAHGLYNLDTASISLYLVFISILGVLFIGLANLIVSFTLALFVALKSKNVTFAEWGNLIRLVFMHLLTHPLDFILPRSKPIDYQHIDNEGHIIHDNNSSEHQYNYQDNMIRSINRKSKKQ